MSYIEGIHSSPERKGRESKKFGEEPLSEERLGDHLAAYGNHEGIAGLLAKMKRGSPYTQGQLDSLANPDEKPLWSKGLALHWCKDSLWPNGLVARELVDKKRGFYGYEKTKEGELGEAFGGQLLDFSEELPVSLYQLSGSTNSPSKTKISETETGEQKETKDRAPLTRFRIAKELVAAKLPIREIDLVTSLQTDYPDSYDYDTAHTTIGRHLSNLAKAKVLIYESREADVASSFYRAVATRPESHLEPFKTHYSLTYRVDRLLSQAEVPLSTQDVYVALLEQYPDYRNN